MLIGYYSGWSINRFLKIVSKGYIAGIFEQFFSLYFSGSLLQVIYPHIRSMILGIVIGGVIPLAFIPHY